MCNCPPLYPDLTYNGHLFLSHDCSMTVSLPVAHSLDKHMNRTASILWSYPQFDISWMIRCHSPVLLCHRDVSSLPSTTELWLYQILSWVYLMRDAQGSQSLSKTSIKPLHAPAHDVPRIHVTSTGKPVFCIVRITDDLNDKARVSTRIRLLLTMYTWFMESVMQVQAVHWFAWR